MTDVSENKPPIVPIEDKVLEHCRQLAQFAVSIPSTPKNRTFRTHAFALYGMAEEVVLNRNAELAKARQAQAEARKEAAKSAVEAPAV